MITVTIKYFLCSLFLQISVFAGGRNTVERMNVDDRFASFWGLAGIWGVTIHLVQCLLGGLLVRAIWFTGLCTQTLVRASDRKSR
jgi:hypothetical protein